MPNLSKTNLEYILLLTTAVCVVLVFAFLPPIAQEHTYHTFSEDKSVLGIPNFWNVISNIGFVVSGFLGFWDY